MIARGPVQRTKDSTVLTRMHDVVKLTSTNGVLGTGHAGPSMGSARPLIPLDIDGPEHTLYRRLCSTDGGP